MDPELLASRETNETKVEEKEEETKPEVKSKRSKGIKGKKRFAKLFGVKAKKEEGEDMEVDQGGGRKRSFAEIDAHGDRVKGKR